MIYTADMDSITAKAQIAQAEGDLPRPAELLAPLHPTIDDVDTLETQLYQTILERRLGPFIAQIKEMLAEPNRGSGHGTGELRFWLGWAQEAAGDHAAAQERHFHQQWKRDVAARDAPQVRHAAGPEWLLQPEAVDELTGREMACVHQWPDSHIRIPWMKHDSPKLRQAMRVKSCA